MIDNLKTFVAEEFPHLTEGSIDALLKLCSRNNGLIYPPIERPDFLLAYYRFFPQRLRAVEEQDFGVLEQLDLRRGPILYVAAFVAPASGYAIVRDVIATLNPMAVCCHRFVERSQEWRFAFQYNRRFNKSGGGDHGIVWQQ